jgi:hypothetical protein
LEIAGGLCIFVLPQVAEVKLLEVTPENREGLFHHLLNRFREKSYA